MQDDRFAYGYDAGNIIDGVVKKDEETGELILVDDDGDVFRPVQALESLLEKKVRVTIISFDALQSMEELYAAAQAAMGKPD